MSIDAPEQPAEKADTGELHSPNQLEQSLAELKPIAFQDKNGVERHPNPIAAECYASPEIQASVSEHFEWVDGEMQSIEETLDRLTETEAQGERPMPFDPLTDDLLRQVLQTATEQLPGLSRTTTKRVPHQTTSGIIFKRKHTEYKDEPITEKVPGYTGSLEDKDTHRRWREAIGGVTRSEYGTKPEDLPAVQQRVQETLTDILTGTEPTWSEKTARYNETKLPLLATKVRDSGITAEQVADMSWEDVAKLVPEVVQLFTDIQAGVSRQSEAAFYEGLMQIEWRLRGAAPVGCQTIARIYYDEQLLEKMADFQQRVRQFRKDPEETTIAVQSAAQEFLDEQHESIAGFFDGHEQADTLYIHGTPYAPRVIKSGALKPTHGMSDDEFTFTTDHGAGTVAGVEGARGVHWATALGGMNYGHDDSQEQVARRLRNHLHERGGEHFAEEELAKGGIGMGRFTMRLGDLISVTPYGGSPLTSSENLRNKRQTPKAKYGVVELTPRGWEQVVDRLSIGKNVSDSAYVAAPEHRDLNEMYDYKYPVDLMMIGVPSQDPDTIKQALRDRGWSEEQITKQTYMYEEFGDGRKRLQAEALAHPKFAHGVVVPIREDL
ncbi:MAG TPA: hypothetical protein VG604_01120 [Candidatus Saccharimonadales bacterium]|nr:hypothetical protein [Candidatus Saccharimonadales bacterium]